MSKRQANGLLIIVASLSFGIGTMVFQTDPAIGLILWAGTTLGWFMGFER